MNLRKYAKGKPCMMRLSGICNYDSDTVVLAHVSRAGNSGMGMKPPDTCAVWACSACHDVIDKRNFMGAYTTAELDGYILDGLIRTLDQLDKDGFTYG